MRFVLAVHGTRGDVEPCAAVGLELQRRDHDVHMAVAPNMVDFVESAGLAAVRYGPDSQEQLSAASDFIRNVMKIQHPNNIVRAIKDIYAQGWAEMSGTLTSLAGGADLLFTGHTYQGVALNVAEYHDIPLAALHYFPVRPNGQVVPILPTRVVRSALTVYEWFGWRMNKKAEDEQLRELGLPKARVPSPRRIAARGSLEIQAYDEACFPGLAAEWAKWNGRRPFVGTLTMGLTTDADDEVASWIAAGTPPICFGFGSMPVESPADTVEMIGAACAELGERALICSGWTDYNDVPCFDHVKVAGPVNYAATFPACRAIVHHGGSGTTAASLRAGVPTLILWTAGDQPFWGNQLKRLKVGASRRFTATTRESLVADLRRILAPEYAIRARELATRMTAAAVSVNRAVDLVEDFARSRCSV